MTACVGILVGLLIGLIPFSGYVVLVKKYELATGLLGLIIWSVPFWIFWAGLVLLASLD